MASVAKEARSSRLQPFMSSRTRGEVRIMPRRKTQSSCVARGTARCAERRVHEGGAGARVGVRGGSIEWAASAVAW